MLATKKVRRRRVRWLWAVSDDSPCGKMVVARTVPDGRLMRGNEPIDLVEVTGLIRTFAENGAIVIPGKKGEDRVTEQRLNRILFFVFPGWRGIPPVSYHLITDAKPGDEFLVLEKITRGAVVSEARFTTATLE